MEEERCQQCGEIGWLDEVEGKLTCTNCGLVVDDFVLGTSYNQVGHFVAEGDEGAINNAGPLFSRVHTGGQLGQLAPFFVIDDLLGKLQVEQAGPLSERALDVVNSVQAVCPPDEPPIARELLPGVAVYIACREEGVPIIMKEVAGIMQYSPFCFGAAYKRVLKDLKMSTRLPGINQYLQKAAHKLVANTPVQVQAKVVAEAQELLEWLLQVPVDSGLRKTPFAQAANALVIACEANKVGVTCEQVATAFSLSGSTTRKHVTKLVQYLLQQASKVPWLVGLNRKTFCFHWRLLAQMDIISRKAAAAKQQLTAEQAPSPGSEPSAQSLLGSVPASILPTEPTAKSASTSTGESVRSAVPNDLKRKRDAG